MIQKLIPYIIAFRAFFYRPKRKEFIEVIECVSVKYDWMSGQSMTTMINELHESILYEKLHKSDNMEFLGVFESNDEVKKHE
jgi:hypothetical protein